MLRPIFLWAFLAQGMATPIAEFQSQVPLTISKDSLLGPQHIGHGLSLWHAGVLVSVLCGGWLFDRSSILLRIPLIGGPTLMNSALFALLLSAPKSLEGTPKLVSVFLLGMTSALANFLLASTFISRHVPPLVMATVSSLMDLFGYTNTLIFLSVNHVAATGDHYSFTLVASMLAGLVCTGAIFLLYVTEHLATQAHGAGRGFPKGLGRGVGGGGGGGGFGIVKGLSELREGLLAPEGVEKVVEMADAPQLPRPRKTV
jgi:hypothetical protein